MKKLFLSCMVLFLTVAVFAQTPSAASTPAHEATKVLVEKYNLDEKQEAQMLKIQTLAKLLKIIRILSFNSPQFN